MGILANTLEWCLRMNIIQMENAVPSNNLCSTEEQYLRKIHLIFLLHFVSVIYKREEKLC